VVWPTPVFEVGFIGNWNDPAMAYNAPRATRKTPAGGFVGYVDCSDAVSSWEVQAGQREQALTPFDSGELQLTLLNDDARWYPPGIFGPYNPYVIEGKKCRFGMAIGSTTYWLHTGFIEEINPNCDWPAFCTIVSHDGLARLAGERFPRRPDLDDSATRKHFGTWNGLHDTWNEDSSYSAPEYGYRVWAEVEAEGYQGELWCKGLRVKITYTDGDGNANQTGHITFNGRPHADVKYKVHLHSPNDTVRRIGNVKVDGGTAQFSKFLVRIYAIPALVQPARSDLQIAALLDSAEWPAGDRVLAAGTHSLIGASPYGNDYLAEAQMVASSELGAVFVDQRGRLVFESRKSRWNAWLGGPDVTLINPGQNQEGFNPEQPFEFAEPRRSIERVINEAIITRSSRGDNDSPRPMRRVNTQSQRRCGWRTFDQESRVFTNGIADTQAQWIVEAYKDGQLNVDQVVIRPQLADDPSALWPIILDNWLSTRVELGLWVGPGKASMAEFNVEGIVHAGEGTEWQTTWTLSPRVGTAPY
jgi:hypothetical protein